MVRSREERGSPDVAIEETTRDWQAVITPIRTDGWRAEYEIGDERIGAPASAADLFVPDRTAGWGRSGPMLGYEVAQDRVVFLAGSWPD